MSTSTNSPHTNRNRGLGTSARRRAAHQSSNARSLSRPVTYSRSTRADGTSGRVEQHRERTWSAECVSLDDRVGGVRRIEPQVRQAVEDRAEPDAQLETGEVHAEALVRPGAEREVVLHGPSELPVGAVGPARVVAVRGS